MCVCVVSRQYEVWPLGMVLSSGDIYLEERRRHPVEAISSPIEKQFAVG